MYILVINTTHCFRQLRVLVLIFCLERMYLARNLVTIWGQPNTKTEPSARLDKRLTLILKVQRLTDTISLISKITLMPQRCHLVDKFYLLQTQPSDGCQLKSHLRKLSISKFFLNGRIAAIVCSRHRATPSTKNAENLEPRGRCATDLLLILLI